MNSVPDFPPLRIFIGYDPREAVAWHVLAHSILRRASVPVSLTPLALSGLSGVLTRPRDPLQSTDFAFARFLVPWLAGYTGWALFMDCDMLVREDIARLWALRDERYAVQVVQHEYTPKTERKFLEQPQTRYARKNWSSVMLMNCARCTMLTPEYVNRSTGLELHGFRWLEDERLIGALPLSWNFLVGEYDPLPEQEIANFHFTLGTPCFPAYQHCDYAELWFAEREAMLTAARGSGA